MLARRKSSETKEELSANDCTLLICPTLAFRTVTVILLLLLTKSSPLPRALRTASWFVYYICCVLFVMCFLPSQFVIFLVSLIKIRMLSLPALSSFWLCSIPPSSSICSFLPFSFSCVFARACFFHCWCLLFCTFCHHSLPLSLSLSLCLLCLSCFSPISRPRTESWTSFLCLTYFSHFLTCNTPCTQCRVCSASCRPF